MAHFALTDSAGQRFVARERLTRGALGLAGASPDPLRVWVKDWSASGAATEDTLSVRLAARRRRHRAGLAARLDGAARRARRPGARRQGCGGRQRVVLLLDTAARRGRKRDDRRRDLHGDRPRVARSRMEHERARARRRRLGLVRAALVGRRQLDVLPPAHGERRGHGFQRRNSGGRQTADELGSQRATWC